MMIFELTPLDRQFANFLFPNEGREAKILKPVVSILSNRVGKGNICLNLMDIAGKTILIDGEEVAFPDLETLRTILSGSTVVGSPGDFRPLVLDVANGRLYLYRYWKYEQDLAIVLLKKAAADAIITDSGILAEGLERLFPVSGRDETDWQKVAALAAVRKRICIISGGPGTGKTSTVIRILALFLGQEQGKYPRMALTAPTGKSAARLRESIALMKESLACDDSIKERLPRDVSTLHRLLGPLPGSVHFRHSSKNPLPYDVVIVDEASMVALPLMAKLATALRDDARLIILGDKDQLSSVEAGAVLGDLCGSRLKEPFSTEFAQLFTGLTGGEITTLSRQEELPPLTDAIVILKKNYRFSEKSGIGVLGQAVNAGEGLRAISVLKSGMFPDVLWYDLPGAEGLKQSIRNKVIEGFKGYLSAESPAEALKRFDDFRFLCGIRQGPCGVVALNRLIEEILTEEGLIDPRQRWYQGRPVLITVNDYHLKLFNGDIGITCRDRIDGEDLPRVCFPAPEGSFRMIPPVRLPAHETVYAMTVHKSQGSEFKRVHMIFPPVDVAILTRELVYTGITRARDSVTIWGKEDIFITAVSRKIQRSSGLRETLWTEESDTPLPKAAGRGTRKA